MILSRAIIQVYEILVLCRASYSKSTLPSSDTLAILKVYFSSSIVFCIDFLVCAQADSIIVSFLSDEMLFSLFQLPLQGNPAQNSYDNHQPRRTNTANSLPDTKRHMKPSSIPLHPRLHPQAKKAMLCLSSGLPRP